MKIYKAVLNIIDPEDFSLIEKGKKIPLRDYYDFGSLSLFSSKDKALVSLKEKIKELDDDYIFVSAIVIEEPVDENTQDSYNYFYDVDLNFIDKKSWYKDDEEIKDLSYKEGEWVYFIYNNKVTIGLIGSQAEGTEPYYILFEDSHIEDCSPHAHTNPLFIWKEIDNKEAKDTLPAKYYENIKRRYKEFSSYIKKRKG